jgi:hypothetical protein
VVGFLIPENTLPLVFEAALSTTSALARVLWALNKEMQKAVKLFEAELGVLAGKEEREKQVRDLLVAMHVRCVSSILLSSR